ncbi:hypothetical protein T440DRAFT_466219 [Plenodomus tracheiphilus IPT5]|uniref:Arginase/deacetylase n=1 Tax=Plenodomus tracheiphilus IPT5 TaxID=1408161 RepID=A0A6A7BD23_9PLEO|nr:hypothetical protein T440DRAFT_466219 [Plenodomus tracheiphilus IPT5]
MASIGAACGLGIENLKFIYLDAHNDMDTSCTNENGASIGMLSRSRDRYSPMQYKDRFLYVGLRGEGYTKDDRGRGRCACDLGAMQRSMSTSPTS